MRSSASLADATTLPPSWCGGVTDIRFRLWEKDASWAASRYEASPSATNSSPKSSNCSSSSLSSIIGIFKSLARTSCTSSDVSKSCSSSSCKSLEIKMSNYKIKPCSSISIRNPAPLHVYVPPHFPNWLFSVLSLTLLLLASSQQQLVRRPL